MTTSALVVSASADITKSRTKISRLLISIQDPSDAGVRFYILATECTSDIDVDMDMDTCYMTNRDTSNRRRREQTLLICLCHKYLWKATVLV
mmetsp:Transcript_31186/g.75385  ORF Transcript_31186/g.75385 Transcript_31186/m.75385 type:complete len:92 (+) Transcript_31186:942-1217(+)